MVAIKCNIIQFTLIWLVISISLVLHAFDLDICSFQAPDLEMLQGEEGLDLDLAQQMRTLAMEDERDVAEGQTQEDKEEKKKRFQADFQVCSFAKTSRYAVLPRLPGIQFC